MLLTYGTYSHPENETEISISQEAVRGPFGQKTGYKARWTVSGRLAGSTVAELRAAIAALETAHADGYDLKLWEDSGVTLSAHNLISGSAIGGVKVVSLGYPDGRGAEYSTFRNYTAVYEAEFITGSGGMVSWDEALQLYGGGPRFVFTEQIQGPPIKEYICQATTFKASQSGSAVAMGTWPNFPPPAFPQHEHIDQRMQVRLTPQYDNGGQSRFGIQWSYAFESSGPITGNPNGPQ